jgi:hypothetical protein
MLLFQFHAGSWGFSAHKSINFQACFKLPPELFAFYKIYIFQIEEWAVKADQRRYIKEDEGMGHYIDLDHYELQSPLDTVIRDWNEAVFCYTQDSLHEHGILPWRIQRVFYYLTEAFKTRDHLSIIKLSADLGHYIADAHVPLHTTQNYNGQLSNQHGIHGLWESRLPELFGLEYDFLDNSAQYFIDPETSVWAMIETSYRLKDSVLLLERLISESFKLNKYSFEKRGSSVVKVYSEEFCEAYHSALNGLVERRMKEAINAVASMWYTAWVNAGQPDLLPSPINETDLPQQVESNSSDSILKISSKRNSIH